MIYAIGDIHGKRDMLEMVLSWVRSEIKEDDTVIFLGDYIDRGQDSKGVVDDVMAFQKDHINTICLMGNHERMMLDAYDSIPPSERDYPTGAAFGHQFDMWTHNGGAQAIESYGTTDWEAWHLAIPQEHWDWFNALDMEYFEGEYYFSHAGTLPENAYWEHGSFLDPRLWVRGEFLRYKEPLLDNRIVVFGHTPQPSGKPLVMANKIGLDTGGVFGGNLTVGVLDPDARGEDRLKFRYYQAFVSPVRGKVVSLGCKKWPPKE